MIPIYFPFTFISSRAFSNLSAFFQKFAAYATLPLDTPAAPAKLAEASMLELRTPIEDENGVLENLVNNYREWGQMHQADNLSYFKTRPEADPYVDESSTPRIQSAIRGDGQHKLDAELPDDLKARLFLHLANEYDAKQAELQQALSSIENMEKNLFQEIGGTRPDSSLPQKESIEFGNADAGSYMTQKRIDAWNLLLQHDATLNGLFVTTSSAVLAHLLEQADTAEKIGEYCPGSATASESTDWQTRFKHFTEELIHSTAHSDRGEPPLSNSAEADTGSPVCKLYLIPGQSPLAFFNRCSSLFNPQTQPTATENEGIQNTLLALVENKA